MTKEEFKRIREALKLSQNKLSKILGVHPNTISNYEFGRTDIPLVVEKYLNMVIQSQESLTIKK